jgi:hypothetical protein
MSEYLRALGWEREGVRFTFVYFSVEIKGWGLDWIERLVLWLLDLRDLRWLLSRDVKEGIWEG